MTVHPRTRRPSFGLSTRSGSMRRWVWGALLSATLIAPLCLSAQDPTPPAGETDASLLRVFLDCNLFRSCDEEHFRREITFVNWVRNREDAHVHLIVTFTQAGSGNEYRFDYVGLGRFEGEESNLTWTSNSVMTEDEVINGITRTMALGFAPYAQRLGLGSRMTIRFQPPEGAGPVVEQDPDVPVVDPWNYWTFSVNVGGELSGQDRRSQKNVNGTFSADRTTEAYRWEFNITGRSNRTENERSDGTIDVTRVTSWGMTGIGVKSLSDHWSLASEFGASASSRDNRRAGYKFLPGIEYNLFPYTESTRRQLIFLYQVGVAWVDWREETIFEKEEETFVEQVARVDLNFRQPWGNGGGAVQAESLLNDFSKWELTFEGNVDIRVFRGFSFNIRGEYSKIRNQLGIRRRTLSDEEILTARSQLATESSWELNFGVRYSFGSIYNNIVNTRFPRSVRGFLF